MKRFKNKVVLVTGAGSGIGRSTAIRMDAEGANLIIVDINEKDLIKTQSMLKNKESHFKVLDISASEDVKKFFADINKLDALINIAGILRFDNSHEVQIDDWNKILNVNLTGTFFMCSYALPLLIKRQGGDSKCFLNGCTRISCLDSSLQCIKKEELVPFPKL